MTLRLGRECPYAHDQQLGGGKLAVMFQSPDCIRAAYFSHYLPVMPKTRGTHALPRLADDT